MRGYYRAREKKFRVWHTEVVTASTLQCKEQESRTVFTIVSLVSDFMKSFNKGSRQRFVSPSLLVVCYL